MIYIIYLLNIITQFFITALYILISKQLLYSESSSDVVEQAVTIICMYLL